MLHKVYVRPNRQTHQISLFKPMRMSIVLNMVVLISTSIIFAGISSVPIYAQDESESQNGKSDEFPSCLNVAYVPPCVDEDGQSIVYNCDDPRSLEKENQGCTTEFSNQTTFDFGGNVSEDQLGFGGNVSEGFDQLGGNVSEGFGGNVSEDQLGFGGNVSDSFGGNASEGFGGNVSDSFGGNVSEDQFGFGGNVTDSFGGNVTDSFGGNVTDSFGGNVTDSFGGNVSEDQFGFGGNVSDVPES